MPPVELEISQKSAEQAGFPELAGVQLVNGVNPIEGALTRKRLTPYQLTVHIMVGGITTRQGIISKLASLCGAAWTNSAMGVGTSSSGVLGKIIASVGVDEPTASASKHAAYNIGRGKYGVTEYGKQLDALMSLDSGSADQTLSQKRADQSAARKQMRAQKAAAVAPALELTATAQQIERVFNDPTTGLIAFKKIASNPAAPESVLAKLFLVYPHLVAANPSWLFAKWTLTPESIAREWNDINSTKLNGAFHTGDGVGKYVNLLSEDDLVLYFKTSASTSYPARYFLSGLPAEKIRLYLDTMLPYVKEKNEYWISSHIGQVVSTAGGWNALSSDPFFINIRKAVEVRLSELGKEWYIEHIFWSLESAKLLTLGYN